MKVLMLGDSHVGKTTYMAAMYKVMADDDSICIHALDRDDDRTLKRFAGALSKGRYPNKTELKSDYDFSLDFKSTDNDFHFFNFSWIDHPGGAIYMPTSEPIPAELRRNLDEVDALVVFLDWTQLNSPTQLRQWNRIKQFMLRFIARANENNLLALTIILTKADINIDFDLDKAVVWQELLKFIGSVNNNQSLLGMLAMSAINRKTTGNVYFTFMRSMCMGLYKETTRKIDIINNRSFWEKIKYALFDDQTRTDMIWLNTFLDAINNSITEHAEFDDGGYILF